MNEVSSPFVEAATYGCLYLSAIFLWVPKMDRIQLWVVALGFSILFGLAGTTLNSVSLLVMAALVLILYCLQNEKYPFLVRMLSAFALFIFGAGLMAHRSMGFDNLLVLNKVLISKDGIPFTLHLYYDQAVLGIFILGFLHERIVTRKEWFKMLKGMSWRAMIVILVVLYASYFFKYVHYDPKFPSSTLLFAVSNLFFICLAEEAFFRGFIQKYLCAVFGRIRFGNGFSILVAASLFGIGHFPGGWHYIILATIAGVGYGWIYYRTQRIEASILTHFTLNMLHFFFFTYPALAKH